MSDVLAELERQILGMSPSELKELDKLIADELKAAWLPNPGPQTQAYYSKADELLYGGAAGGGKSDLIVGLALGPHQRSVIFRRAYGELNDIAERFLEVLGTRTGYASTPTPRYRGDGKMVEFGALEKPGSEKAWRGRAHDLICFDEGGELSEEKVSFVKGWNRSSDPNQRCRLVIASNPPTGGDGEWLIRWFAPWLDPLFPNPAKPGELRWFIEHKGETIWKDGPGFTELEGEPEHIQHISRTFIPARLDDNPYLRESGYRAKLQALPEPLRSQLLKGDFLAGREDHEWQVIPTEWVRLANERWKKAEPKRRKMLALAADIALGGADNSVIARLYEDAWFGEMLVRKGAECKDPADIATWMLQEQRDGADLSVDGTGGWGSGVRSHLKNNHAIECASIVFSSKSGRKTKDGKLGYANERADMYWSFREALDPADGDDIALPPDQRLTAELTAARYRVRGTDILIEDKDEIRKRVGSSTDNGDAVVMAWSRRAASLKPKLKLDLPTPRANGGWMGR